MKIALIGYGKMGKMIEGIAQSRGHEITCRIDVDNQLEFESESFRGSDVAIEFTTPATAELNVRKCFAAGVPVVSGSTGWASRLSDVKKECDEGRGTLMWSSNYSIGVNIFMAVNRYLSRIMDSFVQYEPSMVETHHIHKLDHPSGTALTLAEQIEANNRRVQGWTEDASEIGEGKMLIEHIREGEVPGIHTIKWDSEVDDITITHSAKSRAGFALGAVIAAEWLSGHKGWHTIGEMLDDITKQDIFNAR